MADNKTVFVTLKSKDKREKAKEYAKKPFSIAHANALLQLPNSRWELADDKFKWNGKEIAVNSKK